MMTCWCSYSLNRHAQMQSNLLTVSGIGVVTMLSLVGGLLLLPPRYSLIVGGLKRVGLLGVMSEAV